MSATRIGLSWCLVCLLAFALPGRGNTAPVEAPPLDGFWRGSLRLPGGQLEVIFRLIKLSSGEYFASLDVPLQKVNNLAVTVTVHADTVVLASAEANSRYTGRLSADGSQMQGTWQQPGFTVPLTLAHTALAVAAKPRLTPPYREEGVTFSNAKEKLRLSGTLTIPPGAGPFPTVVLLSDAGSQDRNGTVGDFPLLGLIADYLTRHGVVVLRFDDRGTGQSTGSPQATTADLVSDAEAALNFLRTRPEVNLDRLGLIGHGEGGNVALLTATQPLPPAFVIGLAPYGLPGSEIAVQQQEKTMRSLQTPPEQIEAATTRQRLMYNIVRQTVTNSQAQAIVANMLQQNNPALDNAAAQASAAEMVSARYRYFLTFNPLEALPSVTCPVLLLYGTADFILDADTNLAALIKGSKGNKAVTTRKLLGVNHLFQPDPAQWPIVSGQPKPVFSPAAAEAIYTWITTLSSK